MASLKGMDIFRDHFSEYRDSYVIIGGTACTLIFEELAVPFRATRDIDMVVVIDEVDVAFKQHFLKFIQNGDYRSREMGKRWKNYRFEKPADPSYPDKIELFARKPAGLEDLPGARIVPIEPLDDAYPLSGILLDDEYYEFLLSGRTDYDGITILDALHLIPLKAYAWQQLTANPSDSEQHIAQNILKHRLDVIDLSGTLPGSSRLPLQGSVAEAMSSFIEALRHLDAQVSPDYDNTERADALAEIYL